MLNIFATNCKTCGAPLTISKTKNGICKCEWCHVENYVGGIETIENDSDYEPELIEVTSLGDTTHRYIIRR